MKKTFPDIPDWQFEIEEVSANVYRVTGVTANGHRVQSEGSDFDALLEDAKGSALRISAQLRARS